MPINRDLSNLPRAQVAAGNPPVDNPIIAPLLARHWFEEYVTDRGGPRAKAIADRRFRASWASKRCDRALAYALTDEPESEPMNVADAWRFNIGQMVHDALETMLDSFTLMGYTTASEVAVDLAPIGLDGSATVDLVLTPADKLSRTKVVEIKSINGFGFKMAATKFKSPPEGPRTGAVIQGALAAAALDADLIVVLLSLENLSPSLAKFGGETIESRFCAEWHYPAEEAAAIAAAEVARINRIFAQLDAGVLPARYLHDPGIPAGALVTDPKRGAWQVRQGEQIVQTGTTWMCGYCNHQSTCASQATRPEAATDGPQ